MGLKGSKAVNLALKMLYERASIYFENSQTVGLIITDRPGGGAQQEKGFLEDALQIIQSGTEWKKSTQVPLNILTTESRLVRQLQVADVIVGITTSMFAGATKYATPLFPAVRSLLLRNALKYIGGAGVKAFPDDLTNLYYWVLGENGFSKAWSGIVEPIPSTRFDDYVEDDGMPSRPVAKLKSWF